MRTLPRAAKIPLLALLLVLPLVVASCGGGGGGGNNVGPDPFDVLVVHAVPSATYATDVLTKLAATGLFDAVAGYDASGSTPTTNLFRSYDAVLVMRGSAFDDPIALGNNLAAYSDEGGGVVVTMMSTAFHTIEGAWVAADYHAILPVADDTIGDGPVGWVIDAPGDPLLTGVSLFGGGTDSWRPNTFSVTSGSTLVASWATGEPLIARRTTTANGRVVDLGFYPPTSDVNVSFVSSSGDSMRMVANALLWAGREI